MKFLNRMALVLLACVLTFGFESGWAKNKSASSKKRVSFTSNFKDSYKARIKARRKNFKKMKRLIVKNPKNLQLVPPSKRQQKIMKNVVKKMVLDFSKAKTVKDLVNNAPKRTKMLLMSMSSGKMNEKIPSIKFSEYQLQLFVRGKKRRPMIFSAVTTKKGIQYLVNGRNVTRRKGESLRSWRKRLYGKKQTAGLFDGIFFTKAFAAPYLYWEGVLAQNNLQLDEDAWWNYDFSDNSETAPYGRQLLANAAELSAFRCEGRQASFFVDIGGVHLRVQASDDPNERGRTLLNFSGGGREFSLSHGLSNWGQYGSAYGAFQFRIPRNAENFTPSRDALASLGSYLESGVGMSATLPQSYYYGEQSDQWQEGMVRTGQAYQVCRLLNRHGATNCNSLTNPQDYLNCARDEVLGARLPSAGNWTGAYANVDGRPTALLLRAELSGLLAGPQVHVGRGTTILDDFGIYPIEYGDPISGVSPGTTRANLVTGLTAHLRDDETVFADCVNSISQNSRFTPECQEFINSFPEGDQRNSAVGAIAEMQRGLTEGVNGSGVGIFGGQFAEETADMSADNTVYPTCFNNFNNGDQANSLAHQEQLMNAAYDSNYLQTEVNEAIGNADAARACCSNQRCNMFMNGTLPQEELDRIRGTGSSQ